MKQRFYPAVLERDEGGVYGVWFPDFPGAVAAAHSQEEAMAKAHDVLARAVQERAEREAVLPDPTRLEAIELPAECDFVTFFAVGATPPDPSERVNVYLPRSLIERVDRAAAEWGMSRSSLFGLAVTRVLVGRAAGPAAIVLAAKRRRRP